MGGFNYAVVTYVPVYPNGTMGELTVSCGQNLLEFLSDGREESWKFPDCASGLTRYWTAIDNIFIYPDEDEEWNSGIFDVTDIGDPETIYDLDADPLGILKEEYIKSKGETKNVVRLSLLIDIIKANAYAIGKRAKGAKGHPDIYIHVLTSFA